MGQGVNKVILLGRLGRDPELRYTAKGQAVANMSVATDSSYYDKETKEKIEKTEWHRVVAWGKTGENAAKYLAKGRQVYIEGHLTTSSYEKDGVKHYKTDVVADNVQFLGGGSGESGGRARGGGGGGGGGGGEGCGGDGFGADDEIPF